MVGNLKKALGKKIGFGRFGLPTWAVAIAGMAIVAAAGQAVGPVLSGNVQGSAAVTAEQALVLTDSTSATTTSGGTALAVINDEGTSFTAAIESIVGQRDEKLMLEVDNVSNATANAVLELNVPAGLDVEVASDGSQAQMNASTWLLEVEASTSETVTITIESKDDAKPGFYNISGRLVQISG